MISAEPTGGRATSAMHDMPARTKLIGLIVFALAVVATPREWFGVYALAAGLLIALIVASGIRPLWIAKRLVIEVPFVLFALVLPVVAAGPRIDVGVLSLSTAGLWGAWAMLVKATLALVATLIVVATTAPRRIVLAFEQLGLPRQLTVIMALMLRYVDVIADEFERGRVARASRGFEVRGLRAWRILAASVAGVFIRSHGRGERVHLAMIARGYQETGAG
jgi:cobalt/nickel transport system permease protein